MGSKGKQNCELSHIDWTHKDPKVYMQIQIFQFRKMLRVVGLDCSNESLDLILDLSVGAHGCHGSVATRLKPSKIYN